MLNMHNISVIIVSWNAREFLRDCLRSIQENGGDVIREVIVVDNASNDGSQEMVLKEFLTVALVQCKTNLGFARANNLGMQHAKGPFIALINSDVVVHKRCFERLDFYLNEHTDVGLAGPKVFGSDGRIQMTCFRSPSLWNLTCRILALDRLLPGWPHFSGYEMRNMDHAHDSNEDVLSGCFWLARRAAIDAVGGLDEQFFFYAEDFDWCKRFRDAGWKIAFVPEASATHYGGGSSSNAPLRFSIEILRANLSYWKKHHGDFGRRAFYSLAMLQHVLRFCARSLLRIARRDQINQRKLKEHIVCLRWLLTGREA